MIKKLIISLVLISFLAVPTGVLAEDVENPCSDITDPILQADCQKRYDEALFKSKEDITALIISITNWFAAIVFAIAVIMIIFGAITYITSGGDEDKAGKAKKILTYALIGIAVALLAFGAQALIRSFLEMGGTAIVPTALAYTSPITHYSQISNLILNLTNWFAAIVFAVAVLMIIYGAISYITSRGDEDKAGKAKKIITYALIGIAVAILAFGAQFLVQSFLGSAGTPADPAGNVCHTACDDQYDPDNLFNACADGCDAYANNEPDYCTDIYVATNDLFNACNWGYAKASSL